MMIDRRTAILGSVGAFGACLVGFNPALASARPVPTGPVANVREFGAVGDGVTIDTPAIQRAIDYAAARGGGTVYFPAGIYACYTIRLRSRITLWLDQGSTILAAEPVGETGYDLAEPNPWDMYQDFGHSHWKNSLIWGEGLHDISIEGQGLIWGKGLGRGDGKDDWLKDPNGPGTGNKAIALKNCRGVLLRDFKMLEGGWFALLATGVDNLTIDNVLCDTNRDGFDIDCCRNVRVTNCTVNSPYDDAICPKSSYALGEPRITENVTISNCLVAGNYKIGTVLGGTWERMPPDFAPLIHGRIKFGTETNGGFRNITITNCLFDDSRGLAFQTVDGGLVEDITVSNVTMRGVVNAPLFLRLGRRMRGPEGRPIGTMKRILIQNVSSYNATPLPSVIAGLEGHPIEDLKISDCYLHHVGGAPAAWTQLDPPENALGYPEAPMFGDLPATGFYIRHARNVELSNIEVAVTSPDPRAALWLDDVAGADLFRLRVPQGSPGLVTRGVSDLSSLANRFMADGRMAGPLSRTF